MVVSSFDRQFCSPLVLHIVQDMYWYIAKNEKGLQGMVPGNFLKSLSGMYYRPSYEYCYTNPTFCQSVTFEQEVTGINRVPYTCIYCHVS